MSVLGSYVQCIMAEHLKIQKIQKENARLGIELADTQLRLQLSEERCVTLDEQNEHLQFLLNDLKTCESETQSADTAEVRGVNTPHI